LRTDLTAEEITAQRRVERRLAKIQKAKEKLAEMIASSSPTELVDPLAALDVADETEAAPVEPPDPAEDAVVPEEVFEDSPVVNLEHLQLQREEALFLCWGVGALRILSEEVRSRPLM
jgi:tRNA-splicing endonuclease subunit Sen2